MMELVFGMVTDQLLLMGLSPPVEVDRGQVERGPVWMKKTSWEEWRDLGGVFHSYLTRVTSKRAF